MPPRNLSPLQIQIVEAIQAEIDASAPIILERTATQHEFIKQALIAQNVLRLALEATLEKLVPFDDLLLGELAIRLASYVISVAPEPRHAALIKALKEGISPAHRRRMAEGVRIKGWWMIEGGKD